MRLGHRRRSLCCLKTQNAPWRHWRRPRTYIHEKIDGASNFAAGLDHVRLADCARFARDEIIKSLRSRRRALLWITLHVNVTLWLMRILEVSKCVEIYYTERLNNDWGSRGLSHCHTMWHNARYQTRRWARNACIFWYFISLMKFKADCSFLLGDTLAPNCMAAQCLVF